MIYRMTMPMFLFLIHCRSKAVLTVAVVHHVICNNKKINPKYEKILSETYPS